MKVSQQCIGTQRSVASCRIPAVISGMQPPPLPGPPAQCKVGKCNSKPRPRSREEVGHRVFKQDTNIAMHHNFKVLYKGTTCPRQRHSAASNWQANSETAQTVEKSTVGPEEARCSTSKEKGTEPEKSRRGQAKRTNAQGG